MLANYFLFFPPTDFALWSTPTVRRGISGRRSIYLFIRVCGGSILIKIRLDSSYHKTLGSHLDIFAAVGKKGLKIFFHLDSMLIALG